MYKNVAQRELFGKLIYFASDKQQLIYKKLTTTRTEMLYANV